MKLLYNANTNGKIARKFKVKNSDQQGFNLISDKP
jgi:hypothetical protein